MLLSANINITEGNRLNNTVKNKYLQRLLIYVIIDIVEAASGKVCREPLCGSVQLPCGCYVAAIVVVCLRVDFRWKKIKKKKTKWRTATCSQFSISCVTVNVKYPLTKYAATKR